MRVATDDDQFYIDVPRLEIFGVICCESPDEYLIARFDDDINI